MYKPAMLFVMLFSTPAFAISVRHDYASDQARYTNLANQARFDAVGAFVKGNSNFQAHCSGTIIGPYTVLTAAHCVDGIQKEQLQGFSFVTGPSIASPTAVYRVRDYRIHPSYNSTTIENDLAVLQIYDESSPSLEVKVPSASLYSGSDEITNIFPVILGYGTNGDGVLGPYDSSTAGVKRGALNVVEGFDTVGTVDDTIRVEFTSPGNIFAQSLPTNFLEGNILPGDSGGPVFLNNGSAWAVAGVNSYIIAKPGGGYTYNLFPSSGGYTGHAVRVSQEAAWITGAAFESPTSPWSAPTGALDGYLEMKSTGPSAKFGSLLPASINPVSLSFDFSLSGSDAIVELFFGGESVGTISSTGTPGGTFSGILSCTLFSSCSSPDGTKVFSSMLRAFEIQVTGGSGVSFLMDNIALGGSIVEDFSDGGLTWLALDGNGLVAFVTGDISSGGGDGGGIPGGETPTPIPLPATALLLMTSIFGLAVASKRMKRA